MSKRGKRMPALAAIAEQRPAEREALIEGLVVGGTRGFYEVQTERGVLICTIRGRLRKQLVYGETRSVYKSVRKVKVQQHDPVSIGDRVRALPAGDGTGVIEAVVERDRGAFSRGDPAGGERLLTTVAGLDQLICVFAAAKPEPHLRLLDRLLVLCELQGIAAVICLNKVDLGVGTSLAARLQVYRDAGYPVLQTSVAARRGIEALAAQLAGRTSAFLGPSGVGKTSLLNALQPGAGERTGLVSDSTNKGRHTTIGTRLYPLASALGGYIADTAGIRGLGLPGDVSDRLDGCFPEFRPYLGACRHAGCTHIHEPGCAVRDAVRAGAIDHDRYDSYHRLRDAGRAALIEALDDVR
ncbi:MAG: ribosome small subunit-dependent GTPase A [Dehalococcoidia bacterium]